jgi:hypothetical protein
VHASSVQQAPDVGRGAQGSVLQKMLFPLNVPPWSEQVEDVTNEHVSPTQHDPSVTVESQEIDSQRLSSPK